LAVKLKWGKGSYEEMTKLPAGIERVLHGTSAQEVEESPLLEAVDRKRPVQTHQNGCCGDL
jgi:hypothetical protein